MPKAVTGMMDHALAVGWSKDGAEFGFCVTDGGLGATRCEFVKPDGKREKLSDRAPRGEDIDPALTKAIQARIQQRGYVVTSPAWPYARDLVIAWTSTKPTPQAEKSPYIEVGARLRNASAPTASLVLRPPSIEKFHEFEIHPEAIALSPNGRFLGVVSHSFWGEFTDTFQVEVIPSGQLAGEAYNEAGLALHRQKRFAEAAPLFHKAAYANPASKVAMYNLACALAQLGAPGAQKALSLAIEQGGDAIKQKARADQDFAAVRNEAWFRELTDAAPAR